MKKVIRLTESELLKLVKTIVNERFEVMGELMGKAERFLQNQGIDSSNMDENEIYENIVELTQSEDGRTRHIANRLKAEMLGYMGRPEADLRGSMDLEMLDAQTIKDLVKKHGSE